MSCRKVLQELHDIDGKDRVGAVGVRQVVRHLPYGSVFNISRRSVRFHVHAVREFDFDWLEEMESSVSTEAQGKDRQLKGLS
jgi:hypothetical protein